MADVTAVYTMSDKEVMQALDRIERRMSQHEARARKSMEVAGGSLANAITGSTVRALGGLASITKGIQFAVSAMKEYGERNTQVAGAFSHMGREWSALKNEIGRDLSLLAIGGDSWVGGMLQGIRRIRREWVDATANGLGRIGLGGDGNPVEELQRVEQMDAETAASVLARTSRRQLRADLAVSPLDRVREKAALERERRLREIDEIRVNGRALTPSERAPLINDAELRERRTVFMEEQRIRAENAEAARRAREQDAQALREYKLGLQAVAEVRLFEKENDAMSLRLRGMEKEADAAEVLINAERELIQLRATSKLSLDEQARNEEAILRRAGIQLDILGKAGGKSISGATIAAGGGSILSDRVFGTSGQAGSTAQAKSLDIAKQQLHELRRIAEQTRATPTAVFAP